jgi:hypothetical protein
MNRKWVVAVALIFISAGLSACGEAVAVYEMGSGIIGDGGTNSLMLSWTEPTTNENGSPLQDLAGYIIYFGNGPGEYSYYHYIHDPSRTTAEISELSSNTWYLAVTAFDYFGNESDYSNEVSKTFN